MSHFEDKVPDGIPEWMQQLAKDPLERSHRTLPDPDLLWLKAQLLDRQAAADRALKPARWFEAFVRLLVGFATCWLAFVVTRLLAIPVMTFLSPTLLSLTVSIVLAAVAMLAYPIWSGE